MNSIHAKSPWLLLQVPGDCVRPSDIRSRLETEDLWGDAGMKEVVNYLLTSKKLQLPSMWDFGLDNF